MIHWEKDVKDNKLFRWQDMGGNFFASAWLRFRLMLRLLQDNRINTWLKIIPLFSLVYLVLPLDIPGPIDDALVFWFGMELFIELCPQDVVKELMLGLTKKEDGISHEKKETIIDADFTEIKKDDETK
jgi:uncharacterized membrane protein YkvA (DUF1232 family)